MGGAELFVLGGRAVGESLEFEGEVVLGRDASCELVLTDRSISRRHARVFHDGLQWSVEDLGSRNGVRVGGKRVQAAILRDGDEFVLGDVPLRFRVAASERPSPVSAEPAAVAGSVSEDFEEEILLEEDHEDVSAARSPEPRPRSVPSEEAHPRASVPAPSRADAGGWFRGDLEQRPAWVRALLLLVVVAIAGGLAWAMFRVVTGVRSTL